MKPLLAVITIIIAPLAGAQELDYSVKDGRFFTSAGEIPPGCFGQLMTRLNGDDIVAAIFLGKTSYSGCIDANDPFPGSEEGAIHYQIKNSLGDDTYQIDVCQEVDGSMGASCDQVLVKFVNRQYATDEGSKTVLALEKLGEW